MKEIRNITLGLVFLVPLPAISQRVEYFWDQDPGVGCATTLRTFAGTEAQIETTVNTSSLSPGIHLLGIRAVNGAHYSATYHRQFYVPEAKEQITRIEYYWDRDPGVGLGKAISFTQGSVVDISQKLSTSGLAAGMHILYLRSVSTGHYSLTYTRQFYVLPKVLRVQALEYWFDDDPGVGKAKRISATLTGDSLSKVFSVPTEELSIGIHLFGIRTLTDGTWSETKVRRFLVSSGEQEDNITRLEYFWDTDPGQGRGYPVNITPGCEVNIDFFANMAMLGSGTHTLGLRARSGADGWSPVKYVDNIEYEEWDDLQEYLNSLIDTEDVVDGNTYTRQFLNTDWQSLCVPFYIRYSDWQEHFEVARISKYKMLNGGNAKYALVAELLTSADGDIKPNEPYLIRAKQKGTYTFPFDSYNSILSITRRIQFGNVEFCIESKICESITGMKTAQQYRMQGGWLSIPMSDDEVLPPYRWYLTIHDDVDPNSEFPSSRLDVSDTDLVHINIKNEETTAISNKDHENASKAENQIYNLSGQRISDSSGLHGATLRKGIYIINKQKYLVK